MVLKKNETTFPCVKTLNNLHTVTLNILLHMLSTIHLCMHKYILICFQPFIDLCHHPHHFILSLSDICRSIVDLILFWCPTLRSPCEIFR